MTAFRIGAKLDFVNRDKIKLLFYRHRLNRAYVILRVCRNDFFLTGNKGNRAWPFFGNDTVIIFARKQTKWKTDNPSLVFQHFPYRLIGFSGIGWS